MKDEQRSGSWGWALWSLLGIGGWIGVTVFVAATNDDPSDEMPILRAFALAGGVFFLVTFVGAAVSIRRRRTIVGERLLFKLAPTADPATIRRAARRTQRLGLVYIGFGATTTGLMLAAIGLGEDGPTEALFGIIFVLLLVWVVVAVVGLRSTYKGSADLLAPLGLELTRTPAWVPRPSGGGQLIGDMAMTGERHGRNVAITQQTHGATTVIEGSFRDRRLTDAQRLATLTDEPATTWRRVTASAGSDGIRIVRRGNGAGRWLLADLWLAECLADGC